MKINWAQIYQRKLKKQKPLQDNKAKGDATNAPDKPRKISRKKLLHILNGSFFAAVVIAGIGAGALGLGWQTDRFETPFKKAVNNSFDHTHLVLDIKKMNASAAPTALKLFWGELIYASYIADPLSTLTNDQLKNNPLEFTQYRNFAINRFNNDWVDTGYIQQSAFGLPFFEIAKDINMYTVTQDIFALDLAVGKKFITPLVEPGLFWIFSSRINDLLSPNYKERSFYTFTQNVQAVYKGSRETAYNNAMTTWFARSLALGGELFSNPLLRDPAAANFPLVNNKVWFVNYQFTTLRNELDSDANAFLSDANAAWYQSHRDTAIQNISTGEMTAPNYTAGYFQARVGAWFVVAVIPAVFLICISLSLMLQFAFKEDPLTKKLTLKKTTVKKNQNK